MQRLTKRTKDGVVLNFSDVSEYGEPPYPMVTQKFINKLADYEDLEEQGLMIKLPCKVGDTVWCVEEYVDGAEYGEYIFAGICGEFVLVAVSHIDDDSEFEEKLEEMREDTKSYGVTGDICVFHIRNLFLTEEGALAKLREMEE